MQEFYRMLKRVRTFLDDTRHNLDGPEKRGIVIEHIHGRIHDRSL